MRMYHSIDEVNKKLDNLKTLSEDELRNLVEFLLRDGLVAKQNKFGASFEWSKATENIVSLIKHLVIKEVLPIKQDKES